MLLDCWWTSSWKMIVGFLSHNFADFQFRHYADVNALSSHSVIMAWNFLIHLTECILFVMERQWFLRMTIRHIFLMILLLQFWSCMILLPCGWNLVILEILIWSITWSCYTSISCFSLWIHITIWIKCMLWSYEYYS